MNKIINKTISRSDILSLEARPVIQAIDDLIEDLYSRKLFMTSWYGSLPNGGQINFNRDLVKTIIKKILRKGYEGTEGIGIENRGTEYEPLSGSVDDVRIPWYLYWEIYWVIKNGPKITSSMRLLDCGGTSSLFTCYLASLGSEVHSIDKNSSLVNNGKKIANKMKWNLFSYSMDMRNLDFEDETFDHAYSICVFEHLPYEVKKRALNEIARCLKPNGILSITFDYRNPAPAVMGIPDSSKENQLLNVDDIKRNFLETGAFELLGNQDFHDNGLSYLVNPFRNNQPYTFGAVFLKKI